MLSWRLEWLLQGIFPAPTTPLGHWVIEKKIQSSLEHQRTVPVKKSCNSANKGIWEAFLWCAVSVCPVQLVAALEQPFMSMTGWGNRLQQCCIKARVGKDPVLGTDPNKQELALQGAGQGESRSGAVGGPGSVRSTPQRISEFLHPPSAGKATEGSSNFYFYVFCSH